jgi:hypothetical protein
MSSTEAASNNAAQIHHRHVVGDLGDDADVMGDEDDGHAQLALELLEQVDDLGLGGDVERRGGLVGDQQARVAGESAMRDHGALAHAARELVAHSDRWPIGRGWEFAPGQAARWRGRAPPCGRALQMQLQHLHDLRADGVHRRERAHRLLEDHRDIGAAHGADRGRAADSCAMSISPSRIDPPVNPPPADRLFGQLHHGPAGDRFARAAFADNAERAPLPADRS